MDPELKKALDALGMTQKDAIEAQQKAHAAFIETNEEALKRRDAVLDEKLAKVTTELDKFENLSKALAAADERQKAAAEAAKEQQAQLDRIETKLNRPGAPGEPQDEKAKAYRAAFQDMCRYGDNRRDKLPADRLNVLTISEDTGGGYLAPLDYLREIIKGIVEFSPMREFVRVRTTSAQAIQLPRRTGTFSAQWVGENETRSETQGLSYGLETVAVHELTAEVYISMANLEDSAFDMEEEFRMEAAEQFGVAEGAAIVAGTGTRRPEGFLTAAGTVGVVSGSAVAVTADGIIDLKHAIKTAYARSAAFSLNRSTLGYIRKLKDGSGNYLWMPGLAQGKPNTIDGDPYVEAPDMPSQGAGAKAMAYGDWRRAYTLVDRLAMAVIRDGLTRAGQGQVKFVARRRVGGQVVLPEAIGVMTCASA